jgi:transcriptional regulator with XRE-family HTH domain/GTPase SAR1 family protein
MGVRVRSEFREEVRQKQRKIYDNQSDLAKKARVGKDTVSKFLRGESISHKLFEKIADSLEYSQEEISDLMEVVDNFQPKDQNHEKQYIRTIDEKVPLKKGDLGGSDPNFVGRDSAIARLNQLIYHNSSKGILPITRVCQIVAPGGQGKTTLAKKYLESKFKTVLEFAIAKETKNIASAESLLEEKLLQLGEQPAREFMVSLDRFKQKLQNQPIGILIDNLEPALTLDGSGQFLPDYRSYLELLRVLSDYSLKSITLITSREPLHEPSITIDSYKLEGLSVEAWQEYFNYQKIEINIEDNFLKEIRDAFGGNAKAMDVISKIIRQENDSNLAQYWIKNKEDLLINPTLENLIKEQFKRLQNINIFAYNLLCRMGCFRYQDVPSIPLEGLKCLLWDGEKREQKIINCLKDRGLIEFENNQYWLHPVIRAEAIERLRNSENWEKANTKAAEFWIESAKIFETREDAKKSH